MAAINIMKTKEKIVKSELIFTDEEENAEHVSSKGKEDKINDKICIIEDSQPTTPDGHASNPWSENNVRRRRQDRIAATSAKVAEIKEKTLAAERWEEQKRQLFAPLSICTALILIGVGGGFLYYYTRLQS
ncbi:hypothetical protein Avbf_08671 [Armadillidium vulgare]|nr:hypothetical protein Avbf_08671 [Armadillidium vulgare]